MAVISGKLRRRFGIHLLLAVAIALAIVGPARAQFRLPQLNPWQFASGTPSPVARGCVYLDGHCILQLAAPASELQERLRTVERRLQMAARQYRQSEGGFALTTTPQPCNESGSRSVYIIHRDSRSGSAILRQQQWCDNGPNNIYVALEGDSEPLRLLNLTDLDAESQGQQVEALAPEMARSIQAGLARSRDEREPSYLWGQGRSTVAAFSLAALVTLLSIWGHRFLKDLEERLAKRLAREPVTTQLQRSGNLSLIKLAKRLLRLLQIGVWVAAALYSLGLFPQTRPLQVALSFFLRAPLRIAIVGIGTWIVVRLSFAAIDRFAAALGSNTLLTPDASWRLQLRLTTISGVSKGVICVIWCNVGFLVALSAIGIDIGPILAGAGIVGFAISLASQNLIRDAINGFFIILEDQYGLGDVIVLDPQTGGLVENMNLRITQLRDAEGRLITVPNSEIRTVANVSKHWSRSDLKVPIAYQADADRALEVIQNVLEDLWHDSEFAESILEKPELLGVDEFVDRGIVIRIWIKTRPLKQWSIARESRRRIKAALDTAGIPLAVAQEQIWVEGVGAARDRSLSYDRTGRTSGSDNVVATDRNQPQ